ncbi:MAG TPA: hypothetical protein VHU23_10560 [Rhizomicrobium sp.]|jgi:hypothetical protein|nr:hypothetical protein [Rhizomicrobium sp.]
MRRHFNIVALAVIFAAAASADAAAQSQSGQAAPEKTIDLGFDGLKNGTAFKNYTAHGFTVRRVKPGWTVDGVFGNPAPEIEFLVPANTVVSKAVTVTEAGKEFSLDSIDIYSSVAAVDWQLVGSLKGQTVYKDKGQIPNPMDGFATVDNPDASALVDSIKITLSGVKVAADNPVGLDNIVVEK